MCPDKILLSEYMDREISEEGQKALKIHIASCESCRKQIQEWEQQRQALSVLKDDVSTKTRLDIKNRIEEKIGKKKEIPFWQKEVPWTYAAGLALVFTLGALFAGLSFQGKGNPPPMVDIQKWDDSSYFTLDNSSGSDPFSGSEDSTEIIIDVDASLSYLGESALVHQASFDGGDLNP